MFPRVRKIIFLCLFFSSLSCANANDVYPFQSTGKKQQFEQITQQLRCLVCQNETISESNAALADDLRNQVYKMVHDGKTNAEIKKYMVARYGDFILFKPPLVKRTYLLWFAPFGFLFIGFVILAIIVINHKKNNSMA